MRLNLRRFNPLHRFHRGKNHNEHENESLALIMDVKKGKVVKSLKYIEDSLVPDGSNTKRYLEDMVHYLRREGETITVIDPEMIIVKGEMPSDLYEALVCPDLDVIYGVGVNPWYKSKNLPYIIIICAGVFLLFLMVAGGGGFG